MRIHVSRQWRKVYRLFERGLFCFSFPSVLLTSTHINNVVLFWNFVFLLSYTCLYSYIDLYLVHYPTYDPFSSEADADVCNPLRRKAAYQTLENLQSKSKCELTRFTHSLTANSSNCSFLTHLSICSFAFFVFFLFVA